MSQTLSHCVLCAIFTVHRTMGHPLNAAVNAQYIHTHTHTPIHISIPYCLSVTHIDISPSFSCLLSPLFAYHLILLPLHFTHRINRPLPLLLPPPSSLSTAMHLFGLNWQLQETEGYGAFENGGGGGRDTTPNTFMVSTDNGE